MATSSRLPRATVHSGPARARTRRCTARARARGPGRRARPRAAPGSRSCAARPPRDGHVLRDPPRGREAREIAVPLDPRGVGPRRHAPARELRRRRDLPARGGELRLHELGALRAHRTDGEVGLVAREVARLYRRVELDREPRVACAQAHERGRDEHARHAGRRADADEPLGELVDIGRVARQPRVGRLHRLGGGEHALGGASRREALARALEQLLAEVGLERGEAAADRRRIETEAHGGGGERALAVDRQEDPHVVPADLVGLRFRHGRLQICALPCIRARRILTA